MKRQLLFGDNDANNIVIPVPAAWCIASWFAWQSLGSHSLGIRSCCKQNDRGEKHAIFFSGQHTLPIPPSRFRDRADDQLFEDGRVEVGQTFEIEAALANLVPAHFAQQGLLLLTLAREVTHQFPAADGDGRRQALEEIHVWFLQLIGELSHYRTQGRGTTLIGNRPPLP